MITILDCYTDEPAGLGVPPYLGTYPRYVAGSLDKIPLYITIDDLRAFYKGSLKKTRVSQKTDIFTYNLTKNYLNIKEILENTSELIVISGVHTPGKYLSAVPGTLGEVSSLIRNLKCKKVLTGPATFGSSLEGGKFAEKASLRVFDKIHEFNPSYEEISDYSVKGAEILNQIEGLRIIEIESSKGCPRLEHCSFCTEPLKNKFAFRNADSIVKEVNALNEQGARYFRIGKQTCFYSHPESIEILKGIRKECKAEVLHIDNVNPSKVITPEGEEITKAVVKYCTSGNIAAFGTESFDPDVAKANFLNSDSETTYNAVKVLNKYGRERGENGMPKFLPGINLLFGLIGENKETNSHNIKWLKKMLDEDLWIRRINIRQVDIFEGTPLHNLAGNKYIKKNKKYYWKWREQIRQEIDWPMLQKIVPLGQQLNNVYAEIYDGNTTFARQIGTYPLVIGISGRIELNKFYNVKVTGHMLRSIKAEVI